MEENLSEYGKLAYQMTNDEYLLHVVPLVKEFNKFIKSNTHFKLFGNKWYTYKEVKEAVDNQSKIGRFDTSNEGRKAEYFGYMTDDEYLRYLWEGKYKDEPSSPFALKKDDPSENDKKIVSDLIPKLTYIFSNRIDLIQMYPSLAKSNKEMVRFALSYNLYEKDLKDGIIEISEIEKIGNSVGVKIPKRLYDPKVIKQKEIEAKMSKIYRDLPKVNVEVLTDLIETIRAIMKPYDKIIFDKESERYAQTIKLILSKEKISSPKIISLLPFYHKIFTIGKQENIIEKHSRKKNGYIREESVSVTYFSQLSLKDDYQSVLDKEILDYIESLKNELFASILSHFEKITKKITDIKKLFLGIKNGSIFSEFKFTFYDGSSFDFKNQAVGAGGHTIQRYHFRYLTDFTNIVLPGGKTLDSKTHYNIVTLFSEPEVPKFEKGGSVENVLTVYRGTNEGGEYSGTNALWNGAGIYFTDSEKEAAWYGKVSKYKIKIKNPLHLEKEEDSSVQGSGLVRIFAETPGLSELKYEGKSFKEINDIILNEESKYNPDNIYLTEGNNSSFKHVGYDDGENNYTIYNRRQAEYENEKYIRSLIISEILREKYEIQSLPIRVMGAVNPHVFTQILLDNSFDSIIARNSNFHEGNEYIVFSKENVEKTDEKYKEGGDVAKSDKVLSSSSRFRPYETIVFDPSLRGPSGAILIGYTWTWEPEFTFDKQGEEVMLRKSDWTQAEISADTGRGIVHQYYVQMPDGSNRVVSSESVLILLGYTQRETLKSFPSLVNAVKTLAKQRMKLAILTEQQKQYDDLVAKFTNAPKPEIKLFDGVKTGFLKYRHDDSHTIFSMGDVTYSQVDPFNYNNGTYIKSDIPTNDTKEQLKYRWIDEHVKEEGGVRPYGLYELTNRVIRQERKINQLIEKENNTADKFEDGGQLKKGIAVEKEHTKTIEGIALSKIPVSKAPESISKDHLEENPKYYDKLFKAKLEKGGQLTKLDVLSKKEFPNFENREDILFTLTKGRLFRVYNWANEGGDPEVFYYGFDEQEAKDEFKSNKDDRIEEYRHREQTVLFEELSYKFDQDKVDEILNMSEDEFYDYFSSCKDIAEFVNWNQYDIVDTIDSNDIKPINESSFDLLAETTFKLDLIKEYVTEDDIKVLINSNISSKYSSILITDELGNDIGSIKLRISDHSYNPANNNIDWDKEGFISVVIANEDATKDKFHGINNLYFDESNTVEDIEEKANDKIKFIIESWDVLKLVEKNKFEKGGEMKVDKKQAWQMPFDEYINHIPSKQIKISKDVWDGFTLREKEYILNNSHKSTLSESKQILSHAKKQFPNYKNIHGYALEDQDGTFYVWSGSDTKNFHRFTNEVDGFQESIRNKYSEYTFKNIVQNAIDSGKYIDAIAKHEMTPNEAQVIIKSAGLKVPEDISLYKFEKGGQLNSDKLITYINSKDWWRTYVDEKAVKERGLFLASSYEDAEFYGRPMDTPFHVNIKNPLIGSEPYILNELSLESIPYNAPIAQRFALDKKIKDKAVKKGYDSVVLFAPKSFDSYLKNGRIPKSIELNIFNYDANQKYANGGQTESVGMYVNELIQEAKKFNSLSEFENHLSNRKRKGTQNDVSLSELDIMKMYNYKLEEDMHKGLLSNASPERLAKLISTDSIINDGKIKIYRSSIGDKIRPGDFVTDVREYAENHLENQLGSRGERGGAKIHELEVGLDELIDTSNGFAVFERNEFYYAPKELQDLSPEKIYEMSKTYAKGGKINTNDDSTMDWYQIRHFDVFEFGMEGAKKMAEKYIDNHIAYHKGMVKKEHLKLEFSKNDGENWDGCWNVLKYEKKYSEGGINKKQMKKFAKVKSNKIHIPAFTFMAYVQPLVMGEEPIEVKVVPDIVGQFVAGYDVYRDLGKSKKQHAYFSKQKFEDLIENGEYVIKKDKDNVFANGGEISSKNEIDKIQQKISVLEERLYNAKLKENKVMNNMGWGSGMRKSKVSISTKISDGIEERIKVLKKRLNELLPTVPSKEALYTIINVSDNSVLLKNVTENEVTTFCVEDYVKKMENIPGNSKDKRIPEFYLFRICKAYLDENGFELKKEIPKFARGTHLGFKGLSKKVDGTYEGKKVPRKFEKLYGKVYSKEEAQEVGNKVAAKVNREKQ